MYYFRDNIFNDKNGIEAGRHRCFQQEFASFSGIILMIIFKLKRKEIMPHIFSKRIMYAGFCLTFMTFASLYWSEQYISSGLVCCSFCYGIQ